MMWSLDNFPFPSFLLLFVVVVSQLQTSILASPTSLQQVSRQQQQLERRTPNPGTPPSKSSGSGFGSKGNGLGGGGRRKGGGGIRPEGINPAESDFTPFLRSLLDWRDCLEECLRRTVQRPSTPKEDYEIFHKICKAPPPKGCGGGPRPSEGLAYIMTFDFRSQTVKIASLGEEISPAVTDGYRSVLLNNNNKEVPPTTAATKEQPHGEEEPFWKNIMERVGTAAAARGNGMKENLPIGSSSPGGMMMPKFAVP